MRIVLWDIDGTLVKPAGAGMRALAAAVKVMPAAAQALSGMRLDGMTDYKIARRLCAAVRHHRAPLVSLEEHALQVTRAEMDGLLESYLAVLAQNVEQPHAYEVLDGVVEVLNALEGHAVHALGTGNLEAGAKLKLTPGNLWPRFAFGGFANDGEERWELIAAACKKAEAHLQRKVAPQEFVVVGDTPSDVAAAARLGLACVGVATGRYSVEELLGCGAQDALTHLAQPNAAQRILQVKHSPQAPRVP